MKPTTLALTVISALLISTVAGAQLSLLPKANFILPPGNPVITIVSPTNRTYKTNTLSLDVTFETYITGYEGEPLVSNTTRTFTYTLDGSNPCSITITSSNIQHYPGGDAKWWGKSSLSELTEGLHNLTVNMVSDYFLEPADRFHTESNSTVNFRVDFVPQNISILMPENSTYMPNEVPLQFSIDEPASWTGYSLDGQENVTATGNLTLPELPVGLHNLTLYAKDASGNPAITQTITFSVANPFPTVLVVTVSGASATVVFVSLLVYFKKRKRKN